MIKNFLRQLIYLLNIRKNNSDQYNLLNLKDIEIVDEAASKVIHVHMLWIGKSFSRLEYLSALSFIRRGFKVNLWCYDSIQNIPDGIHLKDANEIINYSEVKKCKNGSYAAFSDIFRYKVLSEKFGIWSDLDVICLVDEIEFRSRITKPFFVSEFVDEVGNIQVNNNLIFVPNNYNSEILKFAFKICESIDIYESNWGAGGPRLLTNLLKIFNQSSHYLMPPTFANPIPSYQCPSLLFKKGQLNPQSWFLHCFNENWRRQGISKEAIFPKNSVIDNATKNYLNEN